MSVFVGSKIIVSKIRFIHRRIRTSREALGMIAPIGKIISRVTVIRVVARFWMAVL